MRGGDVTQGLTVASTGPLLITDIGRGIGPKRAWVSTDGGSRFAPGAPVEDVTFAGAANGRLWTISQTRPEARVTTDGQVWDVLPLPH